MLTHLEGGGEGRRPEGALPSPGAGDAARGRGGRDGLLQGMSPRFFAFSPWEKRLRIGMSIAYGLITQLHNSKSEYIKVL